MEQLPALRQSLVLFSNLPKDVACFLTQHGHAHTAAHCAHVARHAGELADRFGVSTSQAEVAGWLHDVSAVIPNETRIQAALENNIEVLTEEERLPMIVHQKLSALIARDLFGIADVEVLSAVECHTTLKADASTLDKVVFVADKIAWDQSGEPPYLAALLSALERSLDKAAFVYLDYLWERRETLPIVHPWVVAAHQQFLGNC
jgi:predicted HD superfamily hydrolase involved in NAD metabolism